MRRANPEDKAVVIKILMESFKTDPYVTWLSGKSNSPDKLKYLISYVVDETFGNGEIYLSDNNKATALWNSEKRGFQLSKLFNGRTLLYIL